MTDIGIDLTADVAPIEDIAERAWPAFQLDLRPDQMAALLRQPELLVPGTRKRAHHARPARLSLVWHDTPQGDLAAQGVALARCQRGTAAAIWLRTALMPKPSEICPPGDGETLRQTITDPGLAAEAELELPALLLPVVAFEGSTRVLRATPPMVTLLEGELRALTASTPICRVLIEGEAGAALMTQWAALLVATPPWRSLAAEALSLSGRSIGHGVPTRPLGAPSLLAGMDVSTAFAATIAHLAGVLAHHAPHADGLHGPEPVHQMRVALRRLRSAISLFRRAAAGPQIDAATTALKQLGRVLGPARDWDVFTLGLGRRVQEAFADEPAVGDLLAASERKRQSSYAALTAYLQSADWRCLLASLAVLALTRPWETQLAEDEARAVRQRELQQSALRDFAAHALSRRLRALLGPGDDLAGLPVEALHEIRLHCKRLRYAAEFFAPAFPGRATRRFLARLADLQENLGLLNDGAVAASLMAQLAQPGARNASARHLAVGMVRGFVAARSSSARRRIERDWRRLLRQEGFWL